MPSGGDASEGVKAECSNCGATHTPLWRRGLNDELNCNACGLYCKLHKRPRPKTVRTNSASASEPRTQAAAPQCYNCHTTVTPLWRKGDEGKPLCNACGLYYKLHGAARPISMKSDVIRKRSRNDSRRGGGSSSANGGVSASASSSSVSEGPSRRASPTGFALTASSASASAALGYGNPGAYGQSGNKLKHKYTPSYAERASKRRRMDSTSAAQGIVVG
ncbi:hypothetical protein R3P38DRAFT_2545145 [Favolaschia claudopus]|uniref:GATA-type domain-containing protein n=1 Tax=Favolaschia claudopus TaxID=2862362 RepID=A0AAW0AQR1_9AGAR